MNVYIKKLLSSFVGYVFYAMLGLLIAILINQVLCFALTTEFPVVAVLTSSMQHDELTEENHYGFLEKKFGYNRSYINSWPIANGFYIGDMPIVMGSKEYYVGDVVVYSIPNQKTPIIHRIIKINEDGTFMLKGDHNPSPLPFELNIKKEQIHGKVIFVVPKLGWFKVLFSWIVGG
ncbi:MAG: hypothetical protein QXX38_00400 [Candidatus Aenigmatarchaeota archaeon]